MSDRKTFVAIEWIPPIHDKPTRARSAQAMAANGKIHIPDCEWGDRLISQLTSFPAGKYDDAVDVLSLIGLAIDQAHPSMLLPVGSLANDASMVHRYVTGKTKTPPHLQNGTGSKNNYLPIQEGPQWNGGNR